MKTIFLIDDDSDDREIFGESLSSLDLKINYEHARNGAEAFEKLNSETFTTPDLIFLDLNMPIMDGRIFLKEIKKNQKFHEIPIIIYSTSSNDEDKNFAMQNQAAQFMIKHNSMNSLRADLRLAVDNYLRF